MNNIDVTTSIEALQSFLETLGWITNEYVKKITIPGEGNMNVVIRVMTDRRTFILKQSRPFVQKYPDLPAPEERIDVEHQFYKATAEVLKNNSATIIQYAPEHHLLMMEDLGNCEDMICIYPQRSIADKELKELVGLAQNIHGLSSPIDYPLNLQLRELNHQHIFVLPFQSDNGFQLDDVQEGLENLAGTYKNDDQLKSVINSIGERYLSTGTDLIHGDYYPGSWMRDGKKLYVIDSEFSFIGFREFDLGVMAAHMLMTTLDLTYLDKVCSYYSGNLDSKVVGQVAGIETMRRLIGLAQLPLERTLEEKSDLLEMAKEMILS